MEQTTNEAVNKFTDLIIQQLLPHLAFILVRFCNYNNINYLLISAHPFDSVHQSNYIFSARIIRNDYVIVQMQTYSQVS